MGLSDDRTGEIARDVQPEKAKRHEKKWDFWERRSGMDEPGNHKRFPKAASEF